MPDERRVAFACRQRVEPGPAAYDGLLGECTAFLLEGPDASPVAIGP